MCVCDVSVCVCMSCAIFFLCLVFSLRWCFFHPTNLSVLSSLQCYIMYILYNIWRYQKKRDRPIPGGRDFGNIISSPNVSYQYPVHHIIVLINIYIYIPEDGRVHLIAYCCTRSLCTDLVQKLLPAAPSTFCVHYTLVYLGIICHQPNSV